MHTNDPPQPDLLATADGEILAEHNMFRLDDIGSLLALDPEDEPPVPDEELVTSAFGAAIFASALSHHYPLVTLEYWSNRPPNPHGNWERSAEVVLNRGGKHVGLSSGVSRLPGPHRISLPPGSYVLSVWCRGREEVRTRAAAGEARPHGMEVWLLRLWPAVDDAE